MARRLLASMALACVAATCGSGPSQLTCPTKAQSLTFSAAGSCGGGNVSGTVTISTQPGLCSLLVKGGSTVGLPNQGAFITQTHDDLTEGNWQLLVNEGNTQDGSIEITCTIQSTSSSGEVTLSCTGSTCPPDDCGGSGMCTPIDCDEHLTPM